MTSVPPTIILANQDVTSWASVISIVVNVGFAGLVGWYLLTKAIPKMQQDFRDELKSQRGDFDQWAKDRRAEDRDQLKQVIDHCERELVRADQAMKQLSTENFKVIDDNRIVLEEVRDVLRDVRNTLGQRRAK